MDSFTVIKGLHDSEKTQHQDLTFRRTQGMKDGIRQYTLRVDVRANKHQIRQAEELFPKVKVASVNTSRMNGKPSAPAPAWGRTSDWKKAVITLKEGEIELL